MLMFVAVNAEQFPVAAIGRIVIVIVVFVMHRELAKLLALKFAGAAATDRRKKFQGLFPVSRLALLLLPAHFGDHAVTFFGILLI
jgi:hypothetical protein